MEFFCEICQYTEKLKAALDGIDQTAVNQLMNLLLETRNAGKQIYIMGNGGSAATASHFVGDFNKGLSLGKEKRFRFICLCDNTPVVMSLANDVAYEDIFVEQLKNFLSPGDVVIGISGSGNSENVIRAARYAKGKGNPVVAFTGYDGGKLLPLADLCLHVNVDDMQIVEDVHMVFNHMMYSVLSHVND